MTDPVVVSFSNETVTVEVTLLVVVLVSHGQPVGFDVLARLELIVHLPEFSVSRGLTMGGWYDPDRRI